MKNKKGFIPFLIPIIAIGVVLMIIFVLLIIFAPRIAEVTTPIFTFLQDYWWAVGIGIILVLYHQQVRAMLNFIFGKIGIKI